MKTLVAAALLFATTLALGQRVSHQEVCQLRSATLESMARERDQGVPKEKALQTAYAHLPQLKKTPGFREWVDVIYSKDARKWPPKELGAMILSQCLKDPNG